MPYMQCHVARSRMRAFASAAVSSTGGFIALVTVGVLMLAPDVAAADPPVQDPPEPATTVMQGATGLPTGRTIPYWRDTYTDPTNGQTYTETLVGTQDPRTPGAGTTTIPTEIIPINLTFDADGGAALNGSDIAQATVDSPIFNGGDYTAFSNNVSVQYEDAVMRSQFNQVGSSPFHLRLQPTILPALTLAVPADKGQLYVNSRGTRYGCVDGTWLVVHMWSSLGSSHIDPASLPILLTNDSFLGTTRGGQPCVPLALGFHWYGQPGRGTGSINGQGNATVFSSIFASYLQPSLYGARRALDKDVVVLSHEISEWANDPFPGSDLTSLVQPYVQPGRAVYGNCGSYMETGDPVDTVGFHLPGNTYFQTGANAPYADGTYHVQDEVFLPWFARQSPNLTSEPEASSGYGRYTFFGDLNTTPAFHQPAIAC